MARIRAVTRRTERHGEPDGALVAGQLRVDVRTRRATLDGEELKLAAKEFDLLAVLAREPGAVVSRQRIMQEVWNTSWIGRDEDHRRARRVGCRRKLGDPGWIETVRGIGLRLRSGA